MQPNETPLSGAIRQCAPALVAAFVLTGILAGVAGYLLKRGMALLSPKNIKPEQTIATLRRHRGG